MIKFSVSGLQQKSKTGISYRNISPKISQKRNVENNMSVPLKVKC